MKKIKYKVDRICIGCGKEYKAEYKNQQYCDLICRLNQFRAEAAKTNAMVEAGVMKMPVAGEDGDYVNECIYCKLKFQARTNKRMFCSNRCHNAYRGQMFSKWNAILIDEKAEREKKRTKGTKKYLGGPLDLDALHAREAGLSYGQYMAQKDHEKLETDIILWKEKEKKKREREVKLNEAQSSCIDEVPVLQA